MAGKNKRAVAAGTANLTTAVFNLLHRWTLVKNDSAGTPYEAETENTAFLSRDKAQGEQRTLPRLEHAK